MRTRTCVVFILLASLVSVGVSLGQAPEFKTYASTEGRFKILFPGAVKTQTYPVKSGDKELKLIVDSVELRAGTTFLVTYIDTPDDTKKQPSAERLDKVRDGNKGSDGKVIEDKALEVGNEKHPARDVLIEKPSGFLRNRIVIVENRLYQVMVQGPKEIVTSPSADRFLASFEVTR